MSDNKTKKRERDFAQISNNFLRDPNISFKAKGLFSYMFSMEDGWNFTIKSIANQQKDGQAAIIAAMHELKSHGYITYTKSSDGTGTYYLDDCPSFEPNVENPHLGFPKLGKSTRIKNTKLDDKKEGFQKEKNIPQFFTTVRPVNSA
ncbi:hypothetical protein [Sulfurospirillum barnesii]|uniref:Uncharacterized protein n=1 Tax=Sulfurospirillum barnesii (strain ATCC 700032 / DSM 10660 / SES-3) TaxID=760154 RepID=I3Y082_SULBS|nr:hypothetical protein [Sulfurospirillum barnesii]AFL69606.1 hypothetical protein Sulba_2336 [Sulfurospirillum barnesii SES-3]